MQPDPVTFDHAFGTDVQTIKHIISGQSWREGNFVYHQHITVPTLLIYGSNDRFVALEEMLDMQRVLIKYIRFSNFFCCTAQIVTEISSISGYNK